MSVKRRPLTFRRFVMAGWRKRVAFDRRPAWLKYGKPNG